MRKLLCLLTFFAALTISANEREYERKEKDGYKWYEIDQYEPSKGYSIIGAKDVNHNTIIPLSREYTYVSYDPDGYFTVEKDGKIGLCDIMGKEIITPKYSSSDKYFISFDNGYLIVGSFKDGVPYALYDKRGKEIFSTSRRFTHISVCKDGVVWCCKRENCDTYSRDGTYLGAGLLTCAEVRASGKQVYISHEESQTQTVSDAEIAYAVLQGFANGLNTHTASSTKGDNMVNNMSANNEDGSLVGNFQAFGLSSSYGSTSTHRQTFSVYRDSRGYYIIEPRWKNKQYLNVNSYRSYYNYPVGDYNYTTMTPQGTDIFWFFRL